MEYKTIDDLMQHLKEKGIEISGEKDKRNLINTGYFHGYKGYRFFNSPAKKIPFSSYDEIHTTIQYDSDLKSLFYPKVMFIETAVKSIALQCVIESAGSGSIQQMYDKVISSYNNAPPTCTVDERKKLQKNKLYLQNMVQNCLLKAYNSENRKVVHFYHTKDHDGVPLWALFDIMTMGDIGFLLSCLTYKTRDMITRKIGFNLSTDTDRELIYKYLYTLKDLRNAIAHNDVIFDTRFRKINPKRSMESCLKIEIGLPYINFKTITDYVILISYYLKLLKVSPDEIELFIDKYGDLVENYKLSVKKDIADMVIHADTEKRVYLLKKYLKK